MFCTKCGKEVSDNERFCSYCGEKISSNVISESTDFGKANFIGKSGVKSPKLIIGVIIASIVVVALCICLSGGSKESSVNTKARKIVEEQLAKNNQNGSVGNVNSEEPAPTEEIVENPVDREELGREFYEIAKGYWSNDDITYGFVRANNRWFLINTEELIIEYTVENLERDGDIVTAVLADLYRTYDVEISMVSDKAQSVKLRKQDEDWVALQNNTVYSMDELLAKDTYVVPYLIYFHDGNVPSSFFVMKKYFEKDRYLISYIDCFNEVEEELLVKSEINQYTADIWGMKDGFYQPLVDLDSSFGKYYYDSEENRILATSNDGAQYDTYDVETDLWNYERIIGWEHLDTDDFDIIQFVKPGEDYEAAVAKYEEEKAEKEKEKLLTKLPSLDDCMPITKSLDEYEGTFYQGETAHIKIGRISDEVMTITCDEDDNYLIMAMLAPQIGGDYPEGVKAYGGTIEATGRYGYTGSFSGQYVIILMPDGDIFVHRVSGETIFMEGYHSKERGKY